MSFGHNPLQHCAGSRTKSVFINERYNKKKNSILEFHRKSDLGLVKHFISYDYTQFLTPRSSCSCVRLATENGLFYFFLSFFVLYKFTLYVYSYFEHFSSPPPIHILTVLYEYNSHSVSLRPTRWLPLDNRDLRLDNTPLCNRVSPCGCVPSKKQISNMVGYLEWPI